VGLAIIDDPDAECAGPPLCLGALGHGQERLIRVGVGTGVRSDDQGRYVTERGESSRTFGSQTAHLLVVDHDDIGQMLLISSEGPMDLPQHWSMRVPRFELFPCRNDPQGTRRNGSK
jgi:hypothetical protein